MRFLSPTTDAQAPYEPVIRGFINQQFPHTNMDKDDLLEYLTGAFVTTNQHRYGPAPKPENLVAVRRIIRDAVAKDRPIPVLVPWGGRKAAPGHALDIAEIAGLHSLANLQARVKCAYEPGTYIRIRIEDASALFMFREDRNVEREVREYSAAFQSLISVLDLNEFVLAKTEFIMEKTAGLLADLARAYTCPIRAFMDDRVGLTDEEALALTSHAKLRSLGWTGVIPHVQRDFYLGLYRRLYPSHTSGQLMDKLAEYFALSLARVKMGITGKGESDAERDPIIISFVPPIPGMPEEMESKRLYYRTVPMSCARTHIPAWRARGYLRIAGEATPKLASFSDLPGDLIPNHTIIISDDERSSVEVDTSYLLV